MSGIICWMHASMRAMHACSMDACMHPYCMHANSWMHVRMHGCMQASMHVCMQGFMHPRHISEVFWGIPRAIACDVPSFICDRAWPLGSSSQGVGIHRSVVLCFASAVPRDSTAQLSFFLWTHKRAMFST